MLLEWYQWRRTKSEKLSFERRIQLFRCVFFFLPRNREFGWMKLNAVKQIREFPGSFLRSFRSCTVRLWVTCWCLCEEYSNLIQTSVCEITILAADMCTSMFSESANEHPSQSVLSVKLCTFTCIFYMILQFERIRNSSLDTCNIISVLLELTETEIRMSQLPKMQ